MKRVLALLMALALGLCAAAEAAAKPALLTRFSSIVLSVTGPDGEAQTIPLEGLCLGLTLDTTDALQVALEASRGDETLTFAIARLVGNRLRYTVQGAGRTFEAEIPNTADRDLSGVSKAVRKALPMLLDSELPVLKGVSIPKLDLAPLVSLFSAGSESQDGVTTTRFTIPARLVNLLLKQLSKAVRESVKDIPQGEEVAGLLDKQIKSGGSFSVSGVIEDSGAMQMCRVEFRAAGKGSASKNPFLCLNTESADNRLAVSAELPMNDSGVNLGKLALTADPAADRLDMKLDIPGGLTMALNLSVADGLQNAVMRFDTDEAALALTMRYGDEGGQDVCDVDVAVDGAPALRFNTRGAKDGEDSYSGTGHWWFSDGEGIFEIDADYSAWLGDCGPGGHDLPDTIVPASEMTQAEIDAALEPLMDALSGVDSAA